MCVFQFGLVPGKLCTHDLGIRLAMLETSNVSTFDTYNICCMSMLPNDVTLGLLTLRRS